MNEEAYFIGEEDYDRIRKLLDAWEGGRFNTSKTLAAQTHSPPIETRVAQLQDTIGPISGFMQASNSHAVGGNFASSGKAVFYYLDTDNSELINCGLDAVIVYNLFPITVYAGDYVLLNREPLSGQYFIIYPGFSLSSSSASSSSASHFSGSSMSGNGVTVVTDVTCGGSGSGGNGGLHVTDGVLTGSVNINGVNYPVTFSIGGASGA